jgi:hypothetical protein
MPTLSVGQKAERALKLLLALEHAPIAQIMGRHGFAEADRREGWQRLQAIAKGSLVAGRTTARPGTRLIERLDAWENVWFPVADAALRGRFSSVREWLFRNLSHPEGEALDVTVGTFVQRLLRMPTEPSLGVQGAEARELLARRGIDTQTVRIALDLLELLSTTRPRSPESELAAEAAAEAALWSWYREWSEIARVAIADRRLLGELGFAGPQSGARATDEDSEAEN